MLGEGWLSNEPCQRTVYAGKTMLRCRSCQEASRLRTLLSLDSLTNHADQTGNGSSTTEPATSIRCSIDQTRRR